MFKLLKDLFNCLDKELKRKLVILQFFALVISFFEILVVISVGTFVGLLSRGGGGELSPALVHWMIILGANEWSDFMVKFGFIVALIVISSSALSLSFSNVAYKYSAQMGLGFASRLFNYYITRPISYHASRNSSDFVNAISTEVARVNNGIVQPAIELNSKVMLSLFILLTIFFYNTVIAISIFLLLGVVYLFIFMRLKSSLEINGAEIASSYTMFHRALSEGFRGIRELVMRGAVKDASFLFEKNVSRLSRAIGGNNFIAHAPRYVIEVVAYIVVISSSIYIIIFNGGDSEDLLSTMAIFGIAGMKLMPAMHGIYTSSSHIRANAEAFRSIQNDLLAAMNIELPKCSGNSEDVASLKLLRGIRLEKVFFKYGETGKNVLAGVDMEIGAKEIIGIAGISGSGKSTLIDIICGLQQPTSGKIYFDEFDATDDPDYRRRHIAYVSQNIFMSDASIRENVAFFESVDQIDDGRVINALKLANAWGFVSGGTEGIYSKVGEGGVSLSGGQRQRLAIARALYREPSVLVFDEATSALDENTEQDIINEVVAMSDKMTVIMVAHRLKTLSSCSVVYVLESGHVVRKGRPSIVFKED